jgi:elongation factor Ts
MSIFEKVKELRDITGAGMVDCKNALSENNEDIDLSIEYLRKKGIAKAAKKSDRSASEGLITIFDSKKIASIIEINSETDFVAKNPEFNSFCEKVSSLCSASENLNNLKETKFNEKDSVASALINLISKIGENIQIRRFKNISYDHCMASYIHNKQSENSGKLAVLLSYKSDNEKIAKDFSNQLCMHVAASSPQSLDEKSISQDFLENEKKIMKEQLINEGKKPEMIEKIILGKISKIIKDNTLLGQKWVINPELTVQAAIKNFENETKSSFEIKDFVRYKVGEGIVVKKTDFAEEVKDLTN